MVAHGTKRATLAFAMAAMMIRVDKPFHEGVGAKEMCSEEMIGAVIQPEAESPKSMHER